MQKSKLIELLTNKVQKFNGHYEYADIKDAIVKLVNDPGNEVMHITSLVGSIGSINAATVEHKLLKDECLDIVRSILDSNEVPVVNDDPVVTEPVVTEPVVESPTGETEVSEEKKLTEPESPVESTIEQTIKESASTESVEATADSLAQAPEPGDSSDKIDAPEASAPIQPEAPTEEPAPKRGSGRRKKVANDAPQQ